MVPFLDHRADRLDGTIQNRTGIDLVRAQWNLSPGDPRYVEQIVDQASQVSDVTADDLDGPVGVVVAGTGDAEERDGVVDDSEGVSQLVREHRQEFVLSPVVGSDSSNNRALSTARPC